ncbi:MAG: hypothetical protein H7A46_19140 [Verrucomicrobiales bacterium]|nr:hypothetical protein [Verrucomicrobiales bacterium]
MDDLLPRILLAAIILATGCASNPKVSPPGTDADPDVDSEEVRYPLVQPVLLMPGRIVSVRERLRFVVLDFGIDPLQVPGTPWKFVATEPWSGNSGSADRTPAARPLPTWSKGKPPQAMRPSLPSPQIERGISPCRVLSRLPGSLAQMPAIQGSAG